MSDKRPTVSIVVPAYNVGSYIEATLDSVFSQTEKFHEIVVINDGSTDSTREKLERYAHRERIRIIHTPNRGLGPARNEGLDHASGDLVYFLDSDDIIPPGFVDYVTTIAREFPGLDLLLFSGEVFFDSEEPCDSSRYRYDEFYRRVEGVYPSGLDAAAALLKTGVFTPSACLYVSRRSLWNAGLRFRPIIHEDDDVITQLCARARTTYVTDQVLYRRRIRAGSIMSAKTSRRNSDGYFQALRSTWLTYGEMTNSLHRSIVLLQFRAQAWQYLNACRRAGVFPRPGELAFLLTRLKYVPKSEFFRTVIPKPLHKWLRSGKKLLVPEFER
jgi:glycosyltransferase involved in cell wall biosynthesis